MCASYLLDKEWNVGLVLKELASSTTHARDLEEDVEKDLAARSALGLGKLEEAVHRIVVSVFE